MASCGVQAHTPKDPLDFEATALTTRPSRLADCAKISVDILEQHLRMFLCDLSVCLCSL